MKKIFDNVSNDVRIMVGSENPFGKECGSIVTTYTFGDKGTGLFGILGPMRMDYENNIFYSFFLFQLTIFFDSVR